MDARTTFVAQSESPKAMEPGERTFDDPASPAQPAAVRTAAFRQLTSDAAPLEFVPMGLGIVAAIPLHEVRLPQRPAGAAPQRRDTIDERQKLRHVVPVRRREARNNRNPVGVGKNVMFRPGLTAIGRVRSSFFPPRNARSEALSTMARAKSSWPRRRNSASNTRWSRLHTPARCHRTSRRQHVEPAPQPICGGNIFHGIPLRSTNRIPVSTARSGIGLRPAYWRSRRRRFGNSGSSRIHKSSSIKALEMGDRLATGHATVPSLRSKYKRLVR